MYKAFIKANKRKIICESGITLDRAIEFLKETSHGLVISNDGTEYKNKEELEYVKNLRSLPGIGERDAPASRGEVHEDPYRELFELARDNSKPGTECDN